MATEDEAPVFLGKFLEVCIKNGLFDKHKRARFPYRNVTEEVNSKKPGEKFV